MNRVGGKKLLLQRLLGKKVDLVRKQAIREELKDSILRELKIV